MRRGSNVVASLTAIAVLASSVAPAFAGDKKGESRYYAPERRVHGNDDYDGDAAEAFALELVIALPVAVIVDGIGDAIKRNTRKRKKKKAPVVVTQGPPPPIVTMPPPRIYQVLPDGSPAPAADAAPAYATPAYAGHGPAANATPAAVPAASGPTMGRPTTGGPTGLGATAPVAPRAPLPGPTQPGPAMPEGFGADEPDEPLPPGSAPVADPAPTTSSRAACPECWRERVVYEPA
ncbi:MAG: hypothetical protein JNM10_00355, partial [Planctomycetia bacterium]|nr:hypothetical protein [Planctomycetia bacterium]